MKFSSLFVALFSVTCMMVACSKKSEDVAAAAGSTYSAEKPSAIMTGISNAIVATGTGLTTASTAGVQHQELKPMLVASACDSNGEPNSPLNYGSSAYPGTLTYCKMVINSQSPDTVQGGFALVKNISCALEKAGLVFDGQAHSTSITIDSTCFSEKQISEMGGTMTISVTASKPAAFNTYFDAGVVLDVTGQNMIFKIATKVSGTKVEFATMEDQGTNKKGLSYGSLDTADGTLRYETRMERIDCTESGSCGWNRHIKLFADLTMNGNTPGDVESVSFGYSNIQSTPGQSGLGGLLVTASGNLTTGIKARLWQASNGTVNQLPAATSDYNTPGNWKEVSNTSCYTKSSDSAGTCGSGAAGFTSNVNFLLFGPSFTAVSTWFTNFAGATWNAVDVSAD